MVRLARLQRREWKPIALFGNFRKFIGRQNSKRCTRDETLLTVAMEVDPLNNDSGLVLQGETIARALIQQGYIAQKLENQLAWSVCQTSEDWWLLLTFVPRPVAQWQLLPAMHSEYQSKLYSIIEQTICTDFDIKGGRQPLSA